MTAMDGGSGPVARRMRPDAGYGVGESVDMAANLLGTEADGCEGVLDLVGDAAGDFLPCGLLLRTEQLGGVFEDEDVPLMLAARALAGGGYFEESDGGEKVHSAAETTVRCVNWRGDFDLAGSRTHAVAALDEAIEDLGDLRREDLFHDAAVEGTLTAGIHHLAQGAVGENDTAIGIESGYAVGDGFEHGFEFTAAGFEGGVGCAQLHGGMLDGTTAVFEIAGHVIEAATSSPNSSVALSCTRCA